MLALYLNEYHIARKMKDSKNVHKFRDFRKMSLRSWQMGKSDIKLEESIVNSQWVLTEAWNRFFSVPFWSWMIQNI